jgi:hypothetical protein
MSKLLLFFDICKDFGKKCAVFSTIQRILASAAVNIG